MAIRDFGTSLLANVRARKDAGQAEARKYARSQKNKDTRLAFLSPFVSAGLGAIGSAINAGTAQKTQDFLASSNIYDNKIKVKKAGSLIEEGLGYKKEAEDLGITLQELMINKEATAQAKQAYMDFPNRVSEKTLPDYIAMYGRRETTKDLGMQKAEYWKEILNRSDSYQSGKDARTLSDVADSAGPKTVVGSMWRKLTGNTPDVDLLNESMDEMQQVIEAKAITGLSYPVLKKIANEAMVDGATVEEAQRIAGIYISKEEQAETLASIKRGDKVEEDVTYTQGTQGVMEVNITTTTDKRGNKEVTSKMKLLHKPSDDLTSTQLVAMAGGLESLEDHVREKSSEDGIAYANYVYMVAQIVTNPKLNELEKYQQAYTLAYSTDYLNGVKGKGAIRKTELPDVLAAREKSIIELGSGLIIEAAALEGNSDPVSKARKQEIAVQLGNQRQVIANLTDTVKLTADDSTPKAVPPSGPPARYPDAILSPNDGEYYIPDPDRAGKFLKVTGI